MPREVIESVKIVVRTDDGNRFEIQGKGSAPDGMHTAFIALSTKRQEWLLRKMWATHQRRVAEEAATNKEADHG